MPAVYTFPRTALAELVFSFLGQTIVNTIYVQNNADWTSATMDDLADELASWWQTNMAGLISGDMDCTMIRVRDMAYPDSFVIERAQSWGGTVVGAPLPSSVALVVKFGSGLAGRAKRGRNFVTGLTEGQVGGNVVNSSDATAIANAYAAMNGSFPIANGWRHVIASRAGLDPNVGGAGTVYPVLSYSTDGLVHSQRRRLQGSGI